MESVLKYTEALNSRNMENSSESFFKSLLEKCKEGDRSAFEELFKYYEKKVYRTVYRILKDTSLSEDVMQEAFITLFKNIKQFRGEAKFDTYLYRIVVNLCYKKLKKYRNEVSYDSYHDLSHCNPEKQGSELDAAADKIHLQSAVSSLSSEHRIILSLHYIEDFSIDEIGKILNISTGTVKSRLHYARADLKRRLA